MEEKKILKLEDLNNVSGGNDGRYASQFVKVRAKGNNGYLALRTEPVKNDNNIIARIANGTEFEVCTGYVVDEYIYAYYKNTEGWVNSRHTTLQ